MIAQSFPNPTRGEWEVHNFAKPKEEPHWFSDGKEHPYVPSLQSRVNAEIESGPILCKNVISNLFKMVPNF